MKAGDPLTDLKGVGEALGKKFAVLGVRTVGDLLDYYPRRYDDYSEVMPTDKLQPGSVTIEAVIEEVTERRVRRGMHITEAVGRDKEGSVKLIWFNQPYRKDSIKPGKKYFISGQYKLSYQYFSIINPSIEMASDLPINTARILSVYGETKGLTSRQIRAKVSKALELVDDLPETLPASIIKEQKLMSRSRAITEIHMPHTNRRLELARYRLGFEELLQFSLASLLNKYENQRQYSLKIPYNEQLAVKFSQSLPFRLTDTQRLAVMRVYKDMERAWPMSRLIEGDVGSGKTVVAVMAALMVINQKYQVALMAPTEILAKQHYKTIKQLLKPVRHENDVILLTGSLKIAEKASIRESMSSGQAKFIIGTQALIQDRVDMHNLALVIVDEQHRFGVEQRKQLLKKAGHMPHMLNLTATPIPRSLARILYGELDVTKLDSKPDIRKPVITEIVSANSRTQAYAKITTELKAKRQVFVVCPTIYELDGSTSNSVEKVYARIANKDFKSWRVGLLHGKLKPAEKDKIMKQFSKHEVDILVTTTVIEVGVDIPNASVMLIESPERFGLAQIHQLRGRVGRSSFKGYCYLMEEDSKAPSKRLRALESTNDGFKLAELDLEIRGPGALMIGTRQHGHKAAFIMADLSDVKQIDSARKAAKDFINRENLSDYKSLAAIINLLREAVYAD